MFKILSKIIGTKNEREIKRLWTVVEQINSLEPSVTPLSDAELKAKTDEFRKGLETAQIQDCDTFNAPQL